MTEKFEIRDKRTMDSRGNPRMETPDQGPAGARSEQRQQPGGPQARANGRDERPARTDQAFLAFVMNLVAMAYMALGLGEGGLAEGVAPNLAEAKYIIDSLDMLGDKTKGNLSTEEEKGLRGAVYELKMQFARAAGQKARK